MMKKGLTRPPGVGGFGRGGFSLVEVTLALGIVGFAVLAVMGLLPAGLETLRGGMDDTIRTQIVRGLAGQAILTRFEDIEDGEFHFDAEGIPVSGDGYFVARVRVGEPRYPGSASAVDIDSSLIELAIEIGSRGRGTNIYSVYVAKSGK
jgi:uncharacterized protein (TIGR02598 family)